MTTAGNSSGSGGGNDDDGDVGYRRPPKATRYKHGHKGNPWGRAGKPKEPIDFLDEVVEVVLEGRRCRVPRRDLLDHGLFKEAMAGNVSAARELEARRRQREAKKPAEGNVLSEAEVAAVERSLRRKIEREEAPGNALEHDPQSDPNQNEETRDRDDGGTPT